MKTIELNFKNLQNESILKEALIQLSDQGNEFIGWIESESIAYGILNGYYGEKEDAKTTAFGMENDYVMPIEDLINDLT